MGYYIPTSGVVKGKAKVISESWKGFICDYNTARDAVTDPKLGVIVIMDNGPFEAAGFAFSEREFQEFTNPNDNRHKEFVILDREIAKKLTGYEGE